MGSLGSGRCGVEGEDCTRCPLKQKSSTAVRHVLNCTPASASPEVKPHSLQWKSLTHNKWLRPAENCPDGSAPLGSRLLLEIMAGPGIGKCDVRREGKGRQALDSLFWGCFLFPEGKNTAASDDRLGKQPCPRGWAELRGTSAGGQEAALRWPAPLWAVQEGLIFMEGPEVLPKVAKPFSFSSRERFLKLIFLKLLYDQKAQTQRNK